MALSIELRKGKEKKKKIMGRKTVDNMVQEKIWVENAGKLVFGI